MTETRTTSKRMAAFLLAFVLVLSLALAQAPFVRADEPIYVLMNIPYDHLYEGRYSPTNARGKRKVHTVYAKTREECEVLLEKMIAEVRAKMKAEKDVITGKNQERK